MCFNCGCQMPANDMGKGHAGVDPDGKAITIKTFQAAADAFGETLEDTLKHVIELAQKELKKLEEQKAA